MDKQQAYYSLWTRFGVSAYDENRVPEEAELPYITYQVLLGDLDEPIYPVATLWKRDTSWTWLDAKLSEISRYITEMSPIPLDEGYMNVTKGTPFAGRTSDPNDKTIIGYRLNLGIEFLTQY